MLAISLHATAQHGTITNYGLGDYEGGLQNWGISSDSTNIYIANNSGLLRFNGNDWQLLETPGHNPIRCVERVNGRIYIAGDNILGYWEKKDTGEYSFTSLWNNAKALGVDNDVFWNICNYGNNVFFRSYSNILRYDGKELRHMVKDDCYVFIFKTHKGIMAQHISGRIDAIAGNGIEPVFNPDGKPHMIIKFMQEITDGTYLCAFENGEIGIAGNEHGVEILHKVKTLQGKPVKIDNAAFNGDLLVLGTLGDGLYVYDVKNKKPLDFDNSALDDFNIHDVEFASPDDIWASTDVGVTHIDLTPQASGKWDMQDYGVFFDGICFNGSMYMATNRGLISFGETGVTRNLTERLPLAFTTVKDELLVGTTTDLLRLSDDSHNFRSVHAFNGVRQFEYIADNGEEFLILRGYGGLGIMRYNGNRWVFISQVEGTQDYSFILPETPHSVWAVIGGNRLALLHLSQDYGKVDRTVTFDKFEEEGDMNGLCIFKADGKIYFASQNKVFYYQPQTDKFIHDTEMTGTLMPGSPAEIRAIHNLADGKIWCYAGETLRIYSYKQGHIALQNTFYLGQNQLALYDGHYNISLINDSIIMAGLHDGCRLFNLSDTAQAPKPMALEGISYSINDKTLYMPGRCGIIEFPDHATNVQFHVTSTINGIGDRFSYRLNDLTTEWSNWQNSGIISFTSIPAGSHSLEIKDLFGNLLRFNIVVQYPVYKRWWAIVLYIFLGAGMISFIVWRIERQRKMKLKHNLEKENSRLQNELKEQENQALREKVRSQETEMMTNLKFLTQKQELIDAISAEIDKQKMELGDRWPNKNYNRLLKVIQTGTTETDKLLSFENFFVEIHKNFMDRLKAVHSDLSTGELRLACLIRANLTTKEISAVMGIASRSVEIKRYRLKKKLGLPNEASLTTYINTL